MQSCFFSASFLFSAVQISFRPVVRHSFSDYTDLKHVLKEAFMDALFSNVGNLQWQQVVMWFIGGLLIWLAIK